MSAPEAITVVDRDGSEGRHTSLVVESGTVDYPVRVAVALGYGGPSTVALSRTETARLIAALFTVMGGGQ